MTTCLSCRSALELVILSMTKILPWYRERFWKQIHKLPNYYRQGKHKFLGFLGIFPLKNLEFWGYFGERESPNFGDEDGDRVVQTFWDILGMGTAQIFQIYWGISPKKPKFHRWGCGIISWNVWGWFGDGEPPNFGDFCGEFPENPQILGWWRR